MAVDQKLPPLGVLLLHLGACPEALAWAARRPITESALAECPNTDWRDWIGARLEVAEDATWSDWLVAIRRALTGSGSGYGFGSGDGSRADIVIA